MYIANFTRHLFFFGASLFLFFTLTAPANESSTKPAFHQNEEYKLVGPKEARAGQLVVFECISTRASNPETSTTPLAGTIQTSSSPNTDWIVTPIETASGCWSVDSSGSRLYFASPTAGTFTVIAATSIEGRSMIHSAHFFNGTTPPPEPSPQPQPDPLPRNFAEWVKVESQSVDSPRSSRERSELGACFELILSGIDRGTIKSPQAARTMLRRCWAARSAAIHPESAALWNGFLEKLGERIGTELGAEINKLSAIRSLYAEAAEGLNKPAE